MTGERGGGGGGRVSDRERARRGGAGRVNELEMNSGRPGGPTRRAKGRPGLGSGAPALSPSAPLPGRSPSPKHCVRSRVPSARTSPAGSRLDPGPEGPMGRGAQRRCGGAGGCREGEVALLRASWQMWGI